MLGAYSLIYFLFKINFKLFKKLRITNDAYISKGETTLNPFLKSNILLLQSTLREREKEREREGFI